MTLGVRSVTEAEWQTTVVELACLYGWRTYHTHDSRRSDKGFPDLTLVHRDTKRLVFLELKTDVGRVTVEQQAWIDDLIGAGVQAFVVRPSDLDLVHDILNTRRSHG